MLHRKSVASFWFRRAGNALLAASTLLFASRDASAQLLPLPKVVGGTEKLTFADVFGGGRNIGYYGGVPSIVGWMPDGAHYLMYGEVDGERQLLTVDVKTGAKAPLFDTKKAGASLAMALGVSAEEGEQYATRAAGLMDAAHTEGVVTFQKDLYRVRFADGSVTRLTKSPTVNKRYLDFSPDGRYVSYVGNGTDLCVADGSAASPSEKTLTHPGPKVQDATPDWVYEEEVFDRSRGHPSYAWSGDSRHIAFLRLDDTPVLPYAIPNALPHATNPVPELYPVAGDPNPIVSVGIADADGGKPPRFVDLSHYPENDRLVVKLAWTPDSRRVVYQAQNRTQTFLDLNTADVETGAAVATLIHESLRPNDKSAEGQALRGIASIASGGLGRSLDIESSASMFERARKDFSRKEFAASTKALETLVKNFPNSGFVPEAYFLMVESKFQTKDYEGAVSGVDTMVSLFPENDLTGYALIRLAKIYEMQERGEDSVEIYKTVLKFYGDKGLQAQAKASLKAAQ